jgi:hypothetical protein
MPLDKAEYKKYKAGQMVTCKCRRVYIRNTKTNAYRRALLSEI